MIAPPRFMCGTANLAIAIMLTMLRRKMLSTWSRGRSAMSGTMTWWLALFTSISTRPNALIWESTTDCAEVGSSKSAVTRLALRPASRTKRAVSSALGSAYMSVVESTKIRRWDSLGLFFLEIVDRDVCTFTREEDRHRTTNARVTTRDNGVLALKLARASIYARIQRGN